MKVIEHIESAQNTQFSYEIIPPIRGNTVIDIIDIVEKIKPYDPPWIDVTSHSAEASYEEDSDGSIRRIIKKKRPGTISICGIIQNRFNIDTVPHLLCRGFTKEETEDALIELNYLGIQNILAIRGDETNYKKKTNGRKENLFASELVAQINDINHGKYLENLLHAQPMDYCIGVAGYAEKHFEAPNLKTDVQFLRAKVDAGADYIVTQMFFDNSHYYAFVDRCRKAGINVPIIPGLKILATTSQLQTLPKNFYVDLPDELVDEVNESPKNVKEIGQNWCFKQCEDLLNHDVNNLHYYVMNRVQSVLSVVDKLG
tara:strand:+ start:350 stop:1291 length:942 start_codon:yes stop_codon:yes gene_type:complete